MTYYRDLSPYEYWKTVWPPNPPTGSEPCLNIGWLGKEEEFPKGDAPPGFIDRLIDRAGTPARLTRGVHHCEFCDHKSPLRVTSNASHKTAHLGNGEIVVKSTSGVTYMAPTLIVHYVTEHGYLPPKAFIEAVLKLSN
ncbi:hypothetical protein [Streptomyces sp. NPDC090057]|uniref:DUF7919 family protein n=1 Tax=Streptomyces sp. NPDC090057 TaxID=3365935 RepID=UPI00380C5EF5